MVDLPTTLSHEANAVFLVIVLEAVVAKPVGANLIKIQHII